jgi:hypothetical protein
MRRGSLVACLTVVGAVACYSRAAQAAGYFNMPGTHAQRAGHGFGAGYHAPLLLGPMRLDGLGLGNQVRLPCSPAPYCGCALCGECGQMMETPTAMPGAVPTAAPAEAPAPTSAEVSAETSAAEPTPAAAMVPSVESPAAPTVESPAKPMRPIFGAPIQP